MADSSPLAAGSAYAGEAPARTRIVRAAVELYLRDGFAATSVADIAAAAGTSRATFYAQFSSKADVLSELVERFVDEAMELFGEFARLPDTTEASVRGWITRVVALWQRDTELIRLVVSNRTDATNATDRAYLERAVDLVTRNPDHWAELTLRDVRARAFVLVVALRQSLAEWALFDWPVGAEELVVTLTDVWCSTLHPSRRAT